ncbi:ABC transporter substrate-binding protein [Hydrogenibacillus schlegelii]|uniref:SsuA/THI5-like domain-containing protein n=2 Tax=Hydrogenibacillus schlegelii TaxID=1484 RepID=A0A179IRG0_HYDSH|nr:hypothetical protein SA87_07900 [Hydrogenibacillus schlegelii]
MAAPDHAGGFRTMRRRIRWALAAFVVASLVLLGACQKTAPDGPKGSQAESVPAGGGKGASGAEVAPSDGRQDAAPAKALKKLKLYEVTHSLFYAPQYVAKNLGFFREEGLDVEIVSGEGGDKVTTALLSGQADLILVGAEMAVYVNAQNPSDPIVVFARLTQRDGSFLVAREPMPNFRWEDLRGKAYLAQRKGGMPDTIAQHILRKHGLEPGRDLEYLQNVDYANLAPAFMAGTGDVVQLFEPFASQVERAGKGYVVAGLGEEAGTVLYTSYLTRRSRLETDRDAFVAFTRAIARAQTYVLEHDDATVYKALKDDFSGLDREVALKILERLRSQDVWSHDPLPPKEDYARTLELIREAGRLEHPLPYEAVVDPTVAEAALAR